MIARRQRIRVRRHDRANAVLARTRRADPRPLDRVADPARYQVSRALSGRPAHPRRENTARNCQQGSRWTRINAGICDLNRFVFNLAADGEATALSPRQRRRSLTSARISPRQRIGPYEVNVNTIHPQLPILYRNSATVENARESADCIHPAVLFADIEIARSICSICSDRRAVTGRISSRRRPFALTKRIPLLLKKSPSRAESKNRSA